MVPPSQLKDLIDEADLTHIHDEWTKKKFDEGPARYDEYTKRRSAQPRPGAPAGGRGGRGGGPVDG